MNSRGCSVPDSARARLRTTLATIEREISRVPGQVLGDDGRDPLNGLLASWNDLVEQLALGPEPDVRECPVCKHLGMRAATICGYCWTLLAPPHDEDETHGTEGYDIGGES